MIIQRREIESLLRHSKLIKDYSPNQGTKIIIANSQLLTDRFPIHSALYLGNIGEKQFVVEQPCPGKDYRIDNTENWLFGPHFYIYNP